VTSDPPLRFFFLSFGQRYHFFEDKAYLTTTIANARKAIGAGASVVDSLFRAANDFSYTLSAYPSFSLDQSHCHNAIAF
jgi:hypothetical protein